MNELLRNIGLMSLATLVAGAACCGFSFAFVGWPGAWAGLVATLVSLPVGVVVLVAFHVGGVSPGVIVAGTLLRAGLSLGWAGLLAGLSVSLRSPEFFLSIGVIYLANLFVETWLVYCEHRRTGGVSASGIRQLAGN